MASWLMSSGTTATAVAQGVTRYAPPTGALQLDATETNAQLLLRGVYTAKNLMVNCTAIVGTLTVRTRKNTANGGASISVTTTGQKEDTSGTDSLADGDLWNYQCVMSNTHSDAATIQTVSALLDDGGSGGIPVLAGGGSTGLGITAQFVAVAGGLSATTVEANAQVVVQQPTTLSNLRIWVSANTIASTSTFRTRKNGANGNQILSVGSTATGNFEDTSGTDSLVATDKICVTKEAGGASGSVTLKVLQLKSTSGVSQGALASDGSPGSYSASTTRYVCLGGSLLTTRVFSTETDAQVKARVIDTWSNLQARVSANSRSDATTLDFRVGAASPGGGPAISVAAAATGLKEDLTGTYLSGTTDLMNCRLVVGGGTGTITLTTLGVQQGVVATTPYPPWPVTTPNQTVYRM